MKKLALFLPLALLMVVVAACSSIDCPLNNSVYVNYKLVGRVTTLSDTLTITAHRPAAGTDSVLINQQTPTDSFSLPISFGQQQDILFFQTGNLRDTVWIEKLDHPHFESVDCGLNYFHTLTGVRFTRNAIDSITINQKEVTYDATPQHLYVYYKEYRF